MLLEFNIFFQMCFLQHTQIYYTIQQGKKSSKKNLGTDVSSEQQMLDYGLFTTLKVSIFCYIEQVKIKMLFLKF